METSSPCSSNLLTAGALSAKKYYCTATTNTLPSRSSSLKVNTTTSTSSSVNKKSLSATITTRIRAGGGGDTSKNTSNKRSMESAKGTTTETIVDSRTPEESSIELFKEKETQNKQKLEQLQCEKLRCEQKLKILSEFESEFVRVWKKFENNATIETKVFVTSEFYAQVERHVVSCKDGFDGKLYAARAEYDSFFLKRLVPFIRECSMIKNQLVQKVLDNSQDGHGDGVLVLFTVNIYLLNWLRDCESLPRGVDNPPQLFTCYTKIHSNLLVPRELMDKLSKQREESVNRETREEETTEEETADGTAAKNAPVLRESVTNSDDSHHGSRKAASTSSTTTTTATKARRKRAPLTRKRKANKKPTAARTAMQQISSEHPTSTDSYSTADGSSTDDDDSFEDNSRSNNDSGAVNTPSDDSAMHVVSQQSGSVETALDRLLEPLSVDFTRYRVSKHFLRYSKICTESENSSSSSSSDATTTSKTTSNSSSVVPTTNKTTKEGILQILSRDSVNSKENREIEKFIEEKSKSRLTRVHSHPPLDDSNDTHGASDAIQSSGNCSKLTSSTASGHTNNNNSSSSSSCSSDGSCSSATTANKDNSQASTTGFVTFAYFEYQLYQLREHLCCELVSLTCRIRVQSRLCSLPFQCPPVPVSFQFRSAFTHPFLPLKRSRSQLSFSHLPLYCPNSIELRNVNTEDLFLTQRTKEDVDWKDFNRQYMDNKQ